MREFLDCLTAFEFFKDSAQLSLGMHGAIPPPPYASLKCTDKVSFT